MRAKELAKRRRVNRSEIATSERPIDESTFVTERKIRPVENVPREATNDRQLSGEEG